MNPQAPLPEGWQPNPTTRRRLREDYGDEVDLSLALVKFRAYYSEGQVSRNWDNRFIVWCVTDVQRVRERRAGGTDDLGNPLTQSKSTNQGLQPGDPGYVSIEDLATEAQQQAANQPNL